MMEIKVSVFANLTFSVREGWGEMCSEDGGGVYRVDFCLLVSPLVFRMWSNTLAKLQVVRVRYRPDPMHDGIMTHEGEPNGHRRINL